MDESAIQKIQSTGIAAQGATVPEEFKSRVIAVHRDIALHETEQFSLNRYRFRGVLRTAAIADFVQYVRTHKGEGFIDADKLSASVFFNLGDTENPGHADWLATLALKPTAAYTALLGIDGKVLTQQQLIEWLEDWSQNLEAISQDGEALALKTAITAIRKITIKATSETETTQDDFKGARSAFEQIEAKSSLGLPSGFSFQTEPYLGLPNREFKLRLAVLTESDKPKLTLRFVKKEAEQEAIAFDFKELLFREIGEAATLTIGTFTA